MRKNIRIAYTLYFLLVSVSVFGSSSDHLLTLKSKFPYGLLGDDYGVLTINDLALNACHFKPEPFIGGSIIPFEYWQCFKTKAISVACKNVGVLEGEGLVARVAVKVHADQETHKFIEPRPWPLSECRSFVKSLKALMNGQSHACISASYIGNEVDQLGRKAPIGILNRFKTKKGCEGEDCEFTEKIRQEYCPDLKL